MNSELEGDVNWRRKAVRILGVIELAAAVLYAILAVVSGVADNGGDAAAAADMQSKVTLVALFAINAVLYMALGLMMLRAAKDGRKAIPAIVMVIIGILVGIIDEAVTHSGFTWSSFLGQFVDAFALVSLFMLRKYDSQ